MGEVKNSNFREHPSVNAELVKFLSLNSSVEAVDKLQKDYVDISKTNTETSKSINTLGNKLDTNSSIITELKKRVTALERKWPRGVEIQEDSILINNLDLQSSLRLSQYVSTLDQEIDNSQSPNQYVSTEKNFHEKLDTSNQVSRPARLTEEGTLEVRPAFDWVLLFDDAPIWLSVLTN